ncbi:MAG: aminotransferase class IV [Bacteroidia bacterium]|nr:aminotransferase class IV [Bacteroidia bacterium]
MKGGYILFNGKFYRESDPLFTGADLYRLNTGIRESFRTENNLVMFAEDNYNYFINSLLSIGLPIPDDWDLPRFTRDVSRLLNKNHFFLAAKVVIHLIPGVSGTDYILSAEELPAGFYPISEGGLLIDFYEEGAKAPSIHHAYEPSSRFLWMAATRAALSTSKDNLIISNNQGFACESIGGTFGYLIDGSTVFPAPEAQGYCPPILGVVMECAEQSGFKIIEKNEISHEDLLHADELFLVDNCLGIQQVLGLNTRRYYTTGTVNIALKLSEIARKEHQSV